MFVRRILPAVIVCLGPAGLASAHEAFPVHLTTRAGGEISGDLLTHNEQGLVILSGKTPYVFAWSELDGLSAYNTRRTLVIRERGGVLRLTAEDHFQLGKFALRQERPDLAANAFTAAGKLDRSYKKRAKNLISHEAAKQRSDEGKDSRDDAGPANPSRDREGAVAANANPSRDDALVPPPFPRGDQGGAPPDPPEANDSRDDASADSPAWPLASISGDESELRARVREAYLTFGQKVREVLGRDIVLVETDHFLIWTDWRFRDRTKLAEWFEGMYLALCHQFDLDPRQDIFLAKCPAFCFQRPARFRKFAQKFDGYSGRSAVGYTRSIEANGHTHIVLVRQGESALDYDRFAVTLVHEGTHAFVHRLYSSRLIPHWVNEGLADLIAERVLGDRCPTAENAAMLAAEFVRHDWPIRDLLEGTAPIGVHEYALAHSVVALLADPAFSESLSSPGEGLDEGSSTMARFPHFIRALKDGVDVPAALATSYDGMTLEALEAAWRAEHAELLRPRDQ